MDRKYNKGVMVEEIRAILIEGIDMEKVMKLSYLMTNEELQDAIVQTNVMVKSYGEKIPDVLMAHYCELLKIQEKRASLMEANEA